MYQGQVGADFPNIYGGTLSFDAIGSFAKDAVSLSSFSGSNITCIHFINCFININNQLFDPNDVAKATLSNNIGLEVLGRYKRDPFTLYGGYIYARLMNPSDDYLGGFRTIAEGIFVPPGFFSKHVYINNAITDNNYNIQKVLMTWWGGAKWAMRPDVDVAFGYYFQSQNDFNTAPCTGSGINISSNKLRRGSASAG
jgi:hypothetical protein